jgi:SagB-type dehydrogenase family enzyme
VGVRARYRRSPHIVVSWQAECVRLINLGSDRALLAQPVALEILDACSDWSSLEEIANRLPHRADLVDQEVVALADATMLVRLGDPLPDRVQLLDEWGEWSPAAAYFHLATRNQRFVDGALLRPPLLLRRDQPDALKNYTDKPTVELPPFPRVGALPETLLERRTCRKFGADSVSIAHLSALCGLTFGVQYWMEFDHIPRQALKTAPSGGARHSIEAYICARMVDGIDAGMYHYEPDAHALTRLSEESSQPDIASFLPAQPWYQDAAIVVFMTSVFERVQWRYKLPRAYRNILIEAGHLGQTFCLVATWLGLAPFSTAAISENAVEPVLGIDGVSEGVLYAVGAGSRPADAALASNPAGRTMPTLVPPAYFSRPDDPHHHAP